jgi:hypothetical protein
MSKPFHQQMNLHFRLSRQDRSHLIQKEINSPSDSHDPDSTTGHDIKCSNSLQILIHGFQSSVRGMNLMVIKS